MPTRTQRRPARRATSYKPRTSSAPSRRRAAHRASTRIPRLTRQHIILGTLGAGLLVLVTLPFTLPSIINGVEAVTRTFGVLAPLVVVTAAADIAIAVRRPVMDRTLTRRIAGAHLLVLFAFGAAALFTPGWKIGDVSIADVSAGGGLGRFLLSGPLTVLAWLTFGLGGTGLVWPRSAELTRDGALAALHWLNSLEIPQTLWRAFTGFLAGMMPKQEEDEGPPEPPYVARWDEEWQDPPEELEPDEPEIDESEFSGEDIEIPAVTTYEEEEYQPGLPMGRPTRRGWELPPLDLLTEAADVEQRPLDNEQRARNIVETLASFGVDAKVVSISQGPTVTQFGVEPGWEVKTRNVPIKDENGRQIYDKDGKPAVRTEVVSRTRVRVNRITSLSNDLALALAAPTIRIEAPVPGKPIIGIEVPNTTTSLVSLRSVIESAAFQKANARAKLGIALGKGVSGEPVATDLTKMPHLLIAGATGSGKSVCINSIIACFLLHNTPEDLRLVLVDPKRVELAAFAPIPHLAFSKIITDADEIVGTLGAIIHEMDSRYKQFASIGVRNLEAWNKSPRATHKLPHWVVVIDELADLMMAAPYEVERQICRLAQLARATGIHLIVATQRPSVDVVTGLIKANFPTRIAFAVTSQVDSRTIIDMAGAEKLLGKGDMLFMPTDAAKPRRLQGSYVSDADIEKIVDWWANDRFRHLVPEKLDHLLEEAAGEESEREPDEDPLYEAAKELAMQHSRVSTSLLQRRLHIGYPRAARLIDMLEAEGIVAPQEGAGQSRRVLVSADDEEAEAEEAEDYDDSYE